MWTFVSPRIVFGEDALDTLSDIRGKRALVVTDPGIVACGLVAPVLERLASAHLKVHMFSDVEANPEIPTVLLGAKVALEFAPDWIVAVGGGSPLDAAKAIWVLYERPDLQPAEISPFIDLGLRNKARLITIPTTSGTGADVTWAIVLSDPIEKRKVGLGNWENVPDIALVDPSMASGMPRQLTVDTGMDALTHAIEGYISTWHTDMTDGLCAHAAAQVFEFLPRAVTDGADLEARTHMHHAATSAGLGFGNSMASMAHAMGHALGATLGLPHGRAVSLCLPYTLEFSARQSPQRIAQLAQRLGVSSANGETAARTLAQAVRNLASAMGNPLSLGEAGISKDSFELCLDKLVADAENDTQMITSSRSPSSGELRKLFEAVYDGCSVGF
ncbi:iron-containing alcohol dehydrogenase [Candidatus Bipolaricaulota bacterium]|nr:iron-containing alcohol dehydrogenase [Candidatus Bipolaricaulota bacterium]TFH09857.1 MAG: iron-containing alcohol dehydrogenase [Candidatus Atribacteria bacterium]